MRKFLLLTLLLTSTALFAEKKTLYVCETALLNSRPTFSTYNLSFFPIGLNDGHKYKATAYKPRYGEGRQILLVARKFNQELSPALLNAILKFPYFFLRYDMHAEGEKLVIPDDVRLNTFMKNGVQFEALPFYMPQYYDEEYFQVRLAAGFIPVGKTGDAFYHDRMEEHLVGALILPGWLYERYLHYSQFDQALSKASIAQSENDASLLRSYAALRSSPGRNWDTMTSILGYYISRTLPGYEQPVLKEHILELVKTLSGRANSMTVGPTSALRDDMRSRDTGHYFSAAFKQGVTELEKKFAIEKIPDEIILEEALRIISEVHGTPITELRKLL